MPTLTLLADSSEGSAKHGFSEDAIYTLTTFLAAQGLEGTLAEQYLAWQVKNVETLMGRPEYAPPSVTAIDVEIADKLAAKQAAIATAVASADVKAVK